MKRASARRGASDLASLTTLAAGAAHELSTPLATIAVAARELERNAAIAEPAAVGAALKDDARLIRTEVDRCQLDSRRHERPRRRHATTIAPSRCRRPSIAQLAATG